MFKIMTPGPTQIRENVRLARSQEITNPDLDAEFFEEYKETCDYIGDLIGTTNPVFILGGEGILSLEAACASLTEPGDRVLVLDNGVFGKGFAEFVTIYSGEAILFSTDYKEEIDTNKLSDFLEKDHDFKYATLVHCDTPSGVLNDVHSICTMLKSYGILTVVDAVASMFGEVMEVDKSRMDIVCGGSQKVLSAPPGLSFVSVSDQAFFSMENRKVPISSFYCNLLLFKDYYKKKWFPYTMPISDIKGFRAAVDNLRMDKDIIWRHKCIGEGVRYAVRESGLSLYITKGFSNTITAIEVPGFISAKDIICIMREKYHILIAGSFGVMLDKVIRIGHMGENANILDVADTLQAFTYSLEELGYVFKNDLKTSFMEWMTRLKIQK